MGNKYKEKILEKIMSEKHLSREDAEALFMSLDLPEETWKTLAGAVRDRDHDFYRKTVVFSYEIHYGGKDRK